MRAVLTNAAVIVTLTLAPRVACAQANVDPASLDFGTTRIAVGMSETAVRQALHDYVVVTPAQAGPPEWSSVRLKQAKPGAPETLGAVQFRRGRLIGAWIYHPAPFERAEPLEFQTGEALYWAMRSIRGNACSIATDQFVKDDFNQKSISIDCHGIGRAIDISIVRDAPTGVQQASGNVTVRERIFDPGAASR